MAMYMSKRTWTPELEEGIREVCHMVLSPSGRIKEDVNPDAITMFENLFSKVIKWGKKHPTLLRYIDISVTVEGLHRAGQDDWDSHAKRFDNRIIRASTRLATFGNEMSDYYKDKIIPTDIAAQILEIEMPNEFYHNGNRYVKATNGYILSSLADNNDVKRGLYMLSIPSNFIFKINLTEWAHVYKERRGGTNAHPEVKACCEAIMDELQHAHKQLTRELFLGIVN